MVRFRVVEVVGKGMLVMIASETDSGCWADSVLPFILLDLDLEFFRCESVDVEDIESVVIGAYSAARVSGTDLVP